MARVWTCPGAHLAEGSCDGGETYEEVEPDDELPVFFADAGHAAAQQVGRFLDQHLGTLLVRGEFAESTHDAPGLVRLVYFSRTSDWWQQRYELAHEAFHRVATPVGTHHWIHEMLAVRFAVSHLAAVGLADHAAECVKRLEAEAADLSSEEMLAVEQLPYPNGLYGRCYLTSVELDAAVGDQALWQLATLFRNGQPDWRGWLDTLGSEVRARAQEALTG
jgi:hypothetical protein